MSTALSGCRECFFVFLEIGAQVGVESYEVVDAKKKRDEAALEGSEHGT